MDSADFYTYDLKYKGGSLVWLGSLRQYGSPYIVSAELFINTSQEKFESDVDEYLRYHPYGVLPHEEWPWMWEDSRMTQYTYIFIPYMSKAVFTMMHEDYHKKVYDPIIVKKGFGLDDAYIHNMRVNMFKPTIFPKMKEGYLVHGYEYTEPI